MADAHDYAKLVDPALGTVARDVFVDRGVFETEMERIFARGWLFVGHESLIPKPNDYFASRMGQDPVILTRDSQGGVHVLLNSCRHRGMKVCLYDHGNTRNFVCPYHGWSYSTDGRVAKTAGAREGF